MAPHVRVRHSRRRPAARRFQGAARAARSALLITPLHFKTEMRPGFPGRILLGIRRRLARMVHLDKGDSGGDQIGDNALQIFLCCIDFRDKIPFRRVGEVT